MSKVIIGIVGKHIKSDKVRTDTLIRDEVKQAIFDNGAVAIGILSPNEEILYTGDNWINFKEKIIGENLIEQINLCNGIILQGGTTNEAFENLVAKYCYDNDIPCLGICAGQNSIVRALNGTTKIINNSERHYKPEEDYVHSIHINTSSKFFDLINKEEIMVNSRHKRTIDKCPGLDKVAFCKDNYADVVEAKNKKFYFGVRFHPESLYKVDENMNKIFKTFIEECRK